MKKTYYLSVILVFLFVIGVLCCKNKEAEIRVGAVFSQTGDIAPYGEKSIEGMNIAIEEINSNFDRNNEIFKVILEDAMSTGKGAISALLKLIKVDKVKVIIGPCASSFALDCAPIANQNKVVLFATTISADEYSTADDFTFRNWPSAKLITEEMAKLAYNKLNFKDVAVIYINNNMGKSYDVGFNNAFSNMGGEVSFSDGYSPETRDFRTILRRMNNKKPEALILAGQTEMGFILIQMKELKIDIPIITGIGIEDPKVKEIAGDLINGIIYLTASYNPNSESKAVREYEKRYFEKYGKHSEIFAASAYDATKIIYSAIENVGNKPDDIKDYLLTLKNYKGATGSISFDRNGDVIKEVAIKKIIDGEYIFIDENFDLTK